MSPFFNPWTYIADRIIGCIISIIIIIAIIIALIYFSHTGQLAHWLNSSQ